MRHWDTVPADLRDLLRPLLEKCTEEELAHRHPDFGAVLRALSGPPSSGQAKSRTAEVLVVPFALGVLAGATTPTQLAEKCQASPKEAAPLFESGEVERWYAANGWDYPVKMPPAVGLAAVQQFYEALGLVKPPRVDVNPPLVALQGEPGEPVHFLVEVSTPEKRPVYAHATSDVPWLQVGDTELNGNVATLILAIPAVPDRPGETLRAVLAVQANGNQGFEIPVTLEVGGVIEGVLEVAKSDVLEEVVESVEVLEEEVLDDVEVIEDVRDTTRKKKK
jgi:hypothetical protein